MSVHVDPPLVLKEGESATIVLEINEGAQFIGAPAWSTSATPGPVVDLSPSAEGASCRVDGVGIGEVTLHYKTYRDATRTPVTEAQRQVFVIAAEDDLPVVTLAGTAGTPFETPEE